MPRVRVPRRVSLLAGNLPSNSRRSCGRVARVGAAPQDDVLGTNVLSALLHGISGLKYDLCWQRRWNAKCCGGKQVAHVHSNLRESRVHEVQNPFQNRVIQVTGAFWGGTAGSPHKGVAALGSFWQDGVALHEFRRNVQQQ